MELTTQPIMCGIDEAGRGCFAGPLTAASVVLSGPVPNRLDGVPVRDGKTLSRSQRERIYAELVRRGIPIRSVMLSARMINSRGISWVNKRLFRMLVAGSEAESYILDGNLRIGPVRTKTSRIQSVVDADATVPAVILAGIVAKVVRDRYMDILHARYPKYGWNRNAGYGTKRHITAIREHGLTPHHRQLFVRSALRSENNTDQ